MSVSVASRRPPPFSPSVYEPEKRTVQYTLRLTASENAVLEQEAEKKGVTALNFIRAILAERLLRRSKSRR